MSEAKVPHVVQALSAILASLKVDKNGVLPGNMGGKAYITAVDAAAEVKRQFVDNDLIFLPNEEVISNEHIIHKDRLSIRVLIRGTYDIVSTRDGSQVTVSGIGDGLATGTAVASNIGSTNALKNALLRTFLITEQSVEDAAKADTEQVASPVNAKLERARQVSKPTVAAGNPARDKIRKEWIESGKATKDSVNKLMEAVKAADGDLKGDAVFEAVLKRLENGETA